uniref:Putative tail protein n=1 Tax=viral metagenome TaxID=1070528 RepID=A0A6M3JX80_9ZZZZ
MKPILCLDFDGVIHSYNSGWKGARNIPDSPVDGAIEFLEDATSDFDVQIFSSRSNQWGGRRAMRKWLFKHIAIFFSEDPNPKANMHDSGFTSCTQELMMKIKFPNKKPPAMIGLDDRVLTFSGEWPDMEKLKNFKPWNKKGDKA